MDEMEVVRDIASTGDPVAEPVATSDPVAVEQPAAQDPEPQAEPEPQPSSTLFDEAVAAALPDEKARLKYYHDTYSQKVQQAKEQAAAEARAAATAYQDMLARLTAGNPQAAFEAAEKAVAEPQDPSDAVLAKLKEQGFDPEWAESIRDMIKSEAQRLVAPVLKQTEEATRAQTIQRTEAEMVSKYPDFMDRMAAMDALYVSDPDVKRRIDAIPDPRDKAEVMYQTVVFRTLTQTVKAKAAEVMRQQATQRAVKNGAEAVSGGGSQAAAPGSGPPQRGDNPNDPMPIVDRITERPPMFT